MGQILDLPITQQRAIISDCLVDLVFIRHESESISSREDLVKAVEATVGDNLNIEPELERLSFIKDLASMCEVLLFSKELNASDRVSKSLNKGDLDGTSRKPILVISKNVVALRVPAYDKENIGQADNLGRYCKWIVDILSIKNPVIKLMYDSELGKEVLCPSKIGRMMDITTAALRLAPTESGNDAEFKSGLKANLIELLAALRLSRKYAGSIHTKIGADGKGTPCTTLHMLRESVNGRAGLKDHGVDGFPVYLVKAVFNELTKPNFVRFPGGWINSLRRKNNVSNNIGIVYKLGYESVCPSVQKVLRVLKTQVKTTEKQINVPQKSNLKSEKVTQTKKVYETISCKPDTTPEGISYQEYRLGVKLLLPYIDPKGKESLKDQLSRDILTVKDVAPRAFFNKHRGLIDKTNIAYAICTSIGRKGSKSTPLAFRSAKGHAVSLSTKPPFIDRTGKEYRIYSDIPEHVRKFLQHVCFKIMKQAEDLVASQQLDEPGDEPEPQRATRPAVEPLGPQWQPPLHDDEEGESPSKW